MNSFIQVTLADGNTYYIKIKTIRSFGELKDSSENCNSFLKVFDIDSYQEIKVRESVERINRLIADNLEQFHG